MCTSTPSPLHRPCGPAFGAIAPVAARNEMMETGLRLHVRAGFLNHALCAPDHGLDAQILHTHSMHPVCDCTADVVCGTGLDPRQLAQLPSRLSPSAATPHSPPATRPARSPGHPPPSPDRPPDGRPGRDGRSREPDDRRGTERTWRAPAMVWHSPQRQYQPRPADRTAYPRLAKLDFQCSGCTVAFSPRGCSTMFASFLLACTNGQGQPPDFAGAYYEDRCLRPYRVAPQ